MRRQVYDVQKLHGKSRIKQSMAPHRNQVNNFVNNIIKEVNKNDEGEINPLPQTDTDKKSEKSEENSKEKRDKKVIKRLKLDEETLLYENEGLKPLYEYIMKQDFSSKNNVKNLNNLLSAYRNFHYMCFPGHDFDFFIEKLQKLGKTPAIKAYLSRVRNIYKGKETWNVIYDERADIIKRRNEGKNKGKSEGISGEKQGSFGGGNNKENEGNIGNKSGLDIDLELNDEELLDLINDRSESADEGIQSKMLGPVPAVFNKVKE